MLSRDITLVNNFHVPIDVQSASIDSPGFELDFVATGIVMPSQSWIACRLKYFAPSDAFVTFASSMAASRKVYARTLIFTLFILNYLFFLIYSSFFFLLCVSLLFVRLLPLFICCICYFSD
jgi:hypothetical protein